MANYEAPLMQATVTTAYRSAGVLYVNTTASQNRRIQLYEVEFGQVGGLNSTDVQIQWDITRFTATATLAATAVLPNPFDPADSACFAVFANNATGEPTGLAAGSGLSLKNWGINQRGSYRWRALDDGDNIIIPATAAFGVIVRQQCNSFNSAQTAVGNISFVER
jgi:hypothetical protein